MLRLTVRRGFATTTQVGFPALSTQPLMPPLLLPTLGRWWLDLRGLMFLAPVAIPAPSGETTIPIGVPPDTALVGQTVSVQAVIAHEPDPLSWRFSNVGGATRQ